MTQSGLENFLMRGHRKYRSLRLGVVCNQASNDRNLRHISEIFLERRLGLKIACYYGPQHGIRGEKQDNMVESDDFVDERSGLSVYSLYGTSREPMEDSLQKIDAFLIDLQDIGTRIYTFMYTMANCMRAAKKYGKKVIVLDRPNPINGTQVEGNVLEESFASFVGQYPMPVRHGMTMGELALYFNEACEIGCDLEIVKMKGWKRPSFADDFSSEWVPPSPNIPALASAIVFPGMVLFEGTNVSEGRGTTRPFEWVGAPFIDPDKLAKEMNRMKLEGVYFRPIYFQPTYQKCKDQVCGGVHTHVLNRKKFKPFLAGVRLLAKIADMYPDKFSWKKPPYEYEYIKMPIDLIAGTSRLREAVDAHAGTAKFEAQSEAEAKAFLKIRKEFLIYK